MLILQRREGESLVIGDQITLTILSVDALEEALKEPPHGG